MTLIYVFPGQGSQTKGMGGNLFDTFPEETAAADSTLGFSIKELCLDNPDGRLDQTAFTQPALYVVNALSYLQKKAAAGGRADYLAGHSLGEYSALFAAGAFDFVTGLKLVQKRGELMSRASAGAMAAVIGLSREQIAAILEEEPYNTIDIANLNAPDQTVISGPKETIEAVQSPLKKAGAMTVIPLKVSAAFHSRYMQSAQHRFTEFLEIFELNDPQTPVIANVDAHPYRPGAVQSNLARQITQSVQWVDSIRYLLKQPEPQFEEVGPGKVLTGLIRRIQSAN